MKQISRLTATVATSILCSCSTPPVRIYSTIDIPHSMSKNITYSPKERWPDIYRNLGELIMKYKVSDKDSEYIKKFVLGVNRDMHLYDLYLRRCNVNISYNRELINKYNSILTNKDG